MSLIDDAPDLDTLVTIAYLLSVTLHDIGYEMSAYEWRRGYSTSFVGCEPSLDEYKEALKGLLYEYR